MHFYRSDHISSIDPDEFVSVFDLAMRASGGVIKPPDPQEHSLDLVEDDGSVGHVSFPDNPLNRAAFAIRQEYGADPTMFRDIMVRIMALLELADEPDMEGWTKSDPDDPEIMLVNHAVVKAAAVYPMGPGLHFEKEGFFRHVAGIEAENNSDPE